MVRADDSALLTYRLETSLAEEFKWLLVKRASIAFCVHGLF